MRSVGPICAFTANLSHAVKEQTRSAPSSSGWLSKRIARGLEKLLARKVDFCFAFEVSHRGRLHLHGELQVAPHEQLLVRKELRLACGEWAMVRQHQVHTKEKPTVVWPNYSAKDAIYTKRLSGRFQRLSRPINGDWLFATNSIRRKARLLYTSRHLLVMSLLKDLTLH